MKKILYQESSAGNYHSSFVGKGDAITRMRPLYCKLPVRFRKRIIKADPHGLEEIRFRLGKPVELCYGDDRIVHIDEYDARKENINPFDLKKDGVQWSENEIIADEQNTWNEKESRENSMNVTVADMQELLNYLTGYSLYAYEEEMKQGFFTIAGGHRIGVAGRTSLNEEGGDTRLSGMTDIGAVNIRIAHEHRGCALPLMPYIRRGKSDIYNTLFLAQPGIGKTTYLRDCIRLLSSGDDGGVPMKVSVVDERSEIAACHLGEPQNDLGPRTDVLDGCPKQRGMRMLLRSMSPRIIAVDELGGEADFRTLYEVLHSGSRILGTVHSGTAQELRTKPCMRQLLDDGMIERLILLKKDGNGKRSFEVYDSRMALLRKESKYD